MDSLNGGNRIKRGNKEDFEVLCRVIGKMLLPFLEEKKQRIKERSTFSNKNLFIKKTVCKREYNVQGTEK